MLATSATLMVGGRCALSQAQALSQSLAGVVDNQGFGSVASSGRDSVDSRWVEEGGGWFGLFLGGNGEQGEPHGGSGALMGKLAVWSVSHAKEKERGRVDGKGAEATWSCARELGGRMCW